MAWTKDGPFHSKQKLVLSYDRFAKNRTGRPVRRFNCRFERFNAGLITKRFIERTEPDSSPVDGWTGPIFKTMVMVAVAVAAGIKCYKSWYWFLSKTVHSCSLSLPLSTFLPFLFSFPLQYYSFFFFFELFLPLQVEL